MSPAFMEGTGVARLFLVALALAVGIGVVAAMVLIGMDKGLSCLTGGLLASGLAGLWQGRI